MIINDIQPVQLFKDKVGRIKEIVLTVSEINTILKNITIHTNPDNFTELAGFKYNLIDPPEITYISDKIIDDLPKKLFKIISDKLTVKANSKINQCRKDRPCTFVLKRVTILKVGKNKENYSVEGQLLITVEHLNFDYLIRFVISDIGGLNVYYLRLEGYNFSNYFASTIDNKYVNVYSEPIINKYKADKTYMVSSNETNILKSKT